MSKNKPDISKGRTKEWDHNEWQGRSKRQVEANNQIGCYVVTGAGFITFILWLSMYLLT